MIAIYIIIGVACILLPLLYYRHQRRLANRAHLMEEAIRNHDFTFRLPTRGMPFGERAMQEALNHLGDTIRQQMNQREVESWERLTRVLTHEMMNATAPITSISQSLLTRPDVMGTPLEEGIEAIYTTSRHLSHFVANYRKMSEMDKPQITDLELSTLIADVSRAHPTLSWHTDVPTGTMVRADRDMIRQVLTNIAKNAIEADAKKIVVELLPDEKTNHVTLYIGNDGHPIPAENRQSLFVPFFTTKRHGSGIGLSLSRRMMIQQGGMLELAEHTRQGCTTGFIVTLTSLPNN